MHQLHLLALCLPCSLAAAAPAQQPRPLIGVIRWDAWHTPWSRVQPGADDGPVAAMVRSLSPGRYHHRLPFFARVVSENEVAIDGYTQDVVDREIAFAKAGGIDYFACLLYEQDSAMSQGLSLYLSSAHKEDMGFCAIAGPNTFGNAAQFPERMRRIVDLMAEASYVKVAGGRPLLYVFRVEDKWIEAWGGRQNTARLFEGLRAAVREAGHGDPYLVAMNDSAADGRRVMDIIGAEAITAYARTGRDDQLGTPYSELAAAARGFWEECAATGAAVVPLCMSGWDRRPRVEHPVPWETWQQPNAGIERHYLPPTPQELAGHIDDALDWAEADGTRCPAQAIITYAWNEHDEGGWLCPTLDPDGTANTERLEAIAEMLGGR